MLTLGIDTSNYATSLALVNNAEEVVCAKKRFLPVKSGALGLRQSDAVFHHTVALPALLEEIRAQTSLPFTKITAVGVSSMPRPVKASYMPCFLSGVAFAKSFAAGANIPVHETTHQQGHIAAAIYAVGNPALWAQPSIVFHISGGTTEMLLCQGTQINALLGKSLDLYAGQAVDRLGVQLGFSFPAGPYVSELAAQWPEDITPKVTLKGMNCHFSGLENQCKALLAAGKPPAYVAKYCLCAVADTVVGMIAAARQQVGALPVLCAGGVMSSGIISARVRQKVENVYFVPPEFASDNAVGVAVIAALAGGNHG